MVNSPCRATMSCSQASNSVSFGVSALDKRHLRDLLLEQPPERPAVGALVPGLEIGEAPRHVGHWHLTVIRRGETDEGRADDGRKPAQRLGARVALALPAEFGADGRKAAADGSLLAFRAPDGARQRAHQVEPAISERAL